MTTKAGILQAMRRKCLDCCCGQPSEVRQCRLTACALWPFRFGSDPARSQTRGFAKPSGYTQDLPSRGPGPHPDIGRMGRLAKSPVYTADSGKREGLA